MRIRIALAIVACLAVLLGTTGIAGAGNNFTSGAVFAECNTTTGKFDVTLTVVALADGITLTEGAYEARDVDDNEVVVGDLLFDPSTLNNAESTVVKFTVPGNTFDLYTTWRANRAFGQATDFDLDPCVAVPTTTEPPTTAPTETPSTEAPVAAAAVASPRFTG